MATVNFAAAYRGKRVFLTGHTGFKGSWLTQWLLSLGAEIIGYSLPPPTEPSLFVQLGLEQFIIHIEGDVRDLEKLSSAIVEAQPDFVFHLAAQPLVRLSYAQPRETFEVNAMGTINLLEALRSLRKECAAVIVTTDKCYENRACGEAFCEEDALGGHDPYSASKAAAEIAIAAYRRSFFTGSSVAVASARAGNVIGGGDWATDRIVPDCIRSLQKGESIPIRNHAATRPWQHVLEPLSGYLSLGAALAQRTDEALASAFNFGPALESSRPVGELAEQVLRRWPGHSHEFREKAAPHEAQRLSLSIAKAYQLLDWAPVWSFEESVDRTVDWYRQTTEEAAHDPDIFATLTREQIGQYEKARARGTNGSD